MKTISIIEIQNLNPCSSRFTNYARHYKDRSFTPRQFMGLKNITHIDKLWVALRLLSREDVIKAATDIAESVLHIYESKYPNDRRPRECIDAIRLYNRGEITKEQLIEKRSDADAAYAAANAAYAYAFAAAANTAAYAAYAAAYAAAAADADATTTNAAANAARAADATTNAAAAYAYAAATTNADAAAGKARAKQKKLCRTIILRYWR